METQPVQAEAVHVSPAFLLDPASLAWGRASALVLALVSALVSAMAAPAAQLTAELTALLMVQSTA